VAGETEVLGDNLPQYHSVHDELERGSLRCKSATKRLSHGTELRLIFAGFPTRLPGQVMWDLWWTKWH
jgi:hypothetical protein